VDIWVNSAGINYGSTILETDAPQAERLFSINMLGTLWSCMAAGRIMKASGKGSIINISSAGGLKPLPNLSAYGMSKAAVNSLTWSAATEFGPYGIRVNAIAPGYIETPIMYYLYSDENGQIDPKRREEVLGEFSKFSPLGLMGQPSDVAYALLYLGSKASRFVTGQIFRVNGGESM
jgi:3-oxoacyl-[acyl-carrier protein] reductase